jgi:hypothetical protein
MKWAAPSKGLLEYSLAVLLIVLAESAASQMNPQIPDASVSGNQQQRNTEDSWTLQQKHEMAKKQNELRQQDIKKDTDKLLALATELKQYVDKTNENILSMDVIKKADEIEKLARTVKDKMKSQ